ncbi:MAG: UbiH/UbiF/VisC/COQ6 family ubiquinone biosynthesis hydroxylase [Proteobacteria bacterium]|nr:UbiH/UbiF/VisC/COQ6 family ubiquinone biosynthesis hydroxylase [Pseudomonadota bacterium]
MSNAEYDVVIVGAGIVGATLACALADSGLRMALIEARVPARTWPADSRDLRVSAITPGSMRVLHALGVWRNVVAQRAQPFHAMQVWDATGDGAIHFDSADIDADSLGYIVENRVLQHALLERAERHTNIEWRCPESVTAVEFGDAQTTVATAAGHTLRARLVVGADGPDSGIRALAGIATHGWAYAQSALVANVKTARPHQDTAGQRFLPGGPLAFLPLTDGYSAVVWTLPTAEAERLRALDEAAFARELETALESRLGRVEQVGSRACFPLRLLWAEHTVQARLALIGDAAHTVHPLAGQGLNLGIMDAAVLAEVITDARARRKDIGALSILRRYERWRKTDVLATGAALEGLHRLFGSSLAPVHWARNAGLTLTDALTPLKTLIMRHAAGVAGDLPRLAQL